MRGTRLVAVMARPRAACIAPKAIVYWGSTDFMGATKPSLEFLFVLCFSVRSVDRRNSPQAFSERYCSSTVDALAFVIDVRSSLQSRFHLAPRLDRFFEEIITPIRRVIVVAPIIDGPWPFLRYRNVSRLKSSPVTQIRIQLSERWPSLLAQS